MNYSKRIQIAAVLSVIFHMAGLAAWRYYPPSPPPPIPEEFAPIEIDLQPDAPKDREATQLVDVAVPEPEPVAPSPLIAEENSEAMDEAPQDSAVLAPRLKPDDFDQLAAAPAPSAKPEPMPTPPSREEDTADSEEAGESQSESEPDIEFEEMDAPLEQVLAPRPEAPRKNELEDQPIQIAKADPLLPQRPSPGTSRSQESVAKNGVTNFQAIQSEIAPYLKQVREQVEREWNEMLYTRYSGSSPVKAVIDCAISPAGELISVSVVDDQNDLLYSALCKDAVRRAGPFGPFPFVVPDIYRAQNLEIRWTFSFL